MTNEPIQSYICLQLILGHGINCAFFVGRTKTISHKQGRESLLTHFIRMPKMNLSKWFINSSSQKHDENRCTKVGMNFDWRTIADMYEETLKICARVT